MRIRATRFDRRWPAIWLTAAFITASAFSGGAARAGTPGSPWKIVPNPHFGTLTGVSGRSSNELWAVGYYYDQLQGRYRPLAEHWDGNRFQQEKAPTASKGYNAFNAVATVAPNNAWAVGYHTPVYYTYVTSPLIEHWDGSNWSVAPSPFRGEGELTAIAAVAPDDIWAVGFRSANPYGSLILHWNGQAWSIVNDGHASDNTFLRGVVAFRSDDIWVAGSTNGVDGQVVAFAEHWDGASWTARPASPGEEYEEFNALAGSSDGHTLWGVGWQSPGLGYFQMAQRFDGSSWSKTHTPDFPPNNNLYGVASVGQKAWAVGYGSETGPSPLIERWDGSAWRVEPNPAQGIGTLYAITGVGTTLWAVGDNLIMQRST
jgi:hypothetical protein